MKKRKLMSLVLAAVMSLSMAFTVNAEVPYMGDVTDEMTDASYWYSKTENPDEVLADINEINTINADIVAGSGTGVGDLRNVADTVDGFALNDRLKQSAINDCNYFLSIAKTMYTDGGAVLTFDSFSGAIDNTQNPNAESSQQVKFGIVTTRTTLKALPSDMMVLDEQTDYNFDYLYLSPLSVNEPVVIRSISADGNYYYAVASHTGGWVNVEDVAVCKDRAEWLQAWDIEPENVLVVYGDKVTTEETRVSPEVSKRVLTMGTTLRLADKSEWTTVISNRSPYYNHVVWMPVRNDDGSYSRSLCLISQHTKTREGYLPLTYKNIVSVAFNTLGNAYGWGGMLSSNDCSGYVRDVYRCFGFNLGRNTTNQTNQPVKKYDVSGFTREEKEKLLKNLPIGSVLIWSGHEVLYLGEDNGKFYVINAVSSAIRPDGNGLRVRNVIINSVDITRPNGMTWLDTFTTMEIPYIGKSSPGYDHDYLVDGDEDDDKSDDDKSDDDKSDDDKKSDDKKSDDKKQDTPKQKNEWVKGQWYDANGKADYKYKGSWKNDSFGWWYEDTSGWYPKSQWQKIDGLWYYFAADGYMAASEWVDDYWLDSDGALRYEPRGAWKKNRAGWWYEDTSGWQPASQWLKINGKWYYFKENGNLATNTYVEGYWVNSDGVCE